MKKLLALFIGILFCISIFPQAQSNDAYQTGWLQRSIRFSLPAFVSGQYLTNNGTTLSWGAISFAGYLKADGTIPLTANWDVGAYDVHALTFTSDIATGVGAPFSVASTAVVSNLNADLLDGNEAAAFSLSGHNHTGTYEPAFGIATWAGTTNVTILGTIGTGSWHATAIAADHGGTDQTSYAIGDILHATGTTAVGKLADVAVGQVLVSGGVGAVPAYSATPIVSSLTATPTLGTELITGATAMSTWTPVGNWTWGTTWAHTTGDATALTTNWSPTANVQYKIILTITTSTAGNGLSISAGDIIFNATNISTAGTYTYYFTAGATTALKFTPTSGTWIGAITACSVMVTTNGLTTTNNLVVNGQISLPSGAEDVPSFYLTGATTTGLSMAPLNWYFKTGNFRNIRLTNSLSYVYKMYLDGALYLNGTTATLTLGNASATPLDHTIKGPDGSGSDKTGGLITIQGGGGTGAGIPSGVKNQTAYSLPAAATATTLQTQYLRKWEVGKVWSLVNNTDTPIITISCTAGTFVNGKVIYSLEVINNDGSEMQSESGEATFAALQHAAGSAYHIATPGEVSTQIVSTGTLATTWAMVSGSNVVVLSVTSNSDMTMTSGAYTYLRIQIILNSPQIVTLN